MKKTIACIVCGLLLMGFVISCGGGGAKVDARGTTVGQELIDLDKAYKEGVITEKQYNDQKKAILKRK
jgi:hypothetical protein